MHYFKKCLILVLSATICSLASTAYSKNVQYKNYQYMFSFTYSDDFIKKIYVDTPPAPQHGIKVHYINGDTAYIYAEYLTRPLDDFSYEEIEELKESTRACKKIVHTSFFESYYVCRYELIAYKNIKKDDTNILYTLLFKAQNNNNLKAFIEILETFHIIK